MNEPNRCVAPNVSEARDFTRYLVELLRNEQGTMVNFLLALAECDGRRVWASLGYESLFDYLHRELKLSRSAAYFRSAAASLVLRYPEIADALADGRLCLSTMGELGKVITPENAEEILPRFFQLSAREARDLVAELAPCSSPPRREVVTVPRADPPPLPAAVMVAPGRPPTVEATTTLTQGAVLTSGQIECGQDDDWRSTTGDAARAMDRRPGIRIEPLTATLRRIHFTVTKGWMEKLEAAKCAVSHSIPSGSAEEVIEVALDALVEREAKRKGLLVKRPREATPAPDRAPETAKQRRKAIPAHVRREVISRDQGRCQARLHDGTVCGSRVRVQFDHAIPDALGGPSTVENVRLRCERHNQLAARTVFGNPIVDLFSNRRGQRG